MKTECNLNLNKLFIAFKDCGFKRSPCAKHWYLKFNTSNYELFPMQRKQNSFKLYKNACFICDIESPRKIKRAIDLLTETRGE